MTARPNCCSSGSDDGAFTSTFRRGAHTLEEAFGILEALLDDTAAR